jgi:hypothetical protein
MRVGGKFHVRMEHLDVLSHVLFVDYKVEDPQVADAVMQIALHASFRKVSADNISGSKQVFEHVVHDTLRVSNVDVFHDESEAVLLRNFFSSPSLLSHQGWCEYLPYTGDLVEQHLLHLLHGVVAMMKALLSAMAL